MNPARLVAHIVDPYQSHYPTFVGAKVSQKASDLSRSMPAKAGIQTWPHTLRPWIPAFTGMTRASLAIAFACLLRRSIRELAVARIRAFPNGLYRKYGVDVTKTVLTVTVYSPFDFLKFFNHRKLSLGCFYGYRRLSGSIGNR
jgi:hypothetical protein